MEDINFIKIYLLFAQALFLGMHTGASLQAKTPTTAISSTSAQTLKEKKQRQLFTAQIGFSGLSVDNLQNQVLSFGVLTDMAMEQNFTESLNAFVQAKLLLETGSNKSIRSEEYRPKQSISLKNAYLNYAPNTFGLIKVGALNQGFLKAPLLVTDTPFLGVSERLFYKKRAREFYLQAEQTIPNNHTLANRLGHVDEGTPTFLLAGGGFNYNGELIRFESFISFFKYHNLSNSVAHESRLMGNSIRGNSKALAKFIYDFAGLNARYKYAMNITPQIEIFTETRYLFNQKAPDSRNTALQFFIGLEKNHIQFYYENFYSESDAAPAFYNSKFYFHNNQKGQGLGTKINWAKQNLSLEANFLQARPLRENSYQSKSKIVQMNLVRSYDF